MFALVEQHHAQQQRHHPHADNVEKNEHARLAVRRCAFSWEGGVQAKDVNTAITQQKIFPEFAVGQQHDGFNANGGEQ